MKRLFLILIFSILTACSESNNTESGELVLNSNIDLTDLHGNWVNACLLNIDYENIYKREFLKTFGNTSDNPSVISIGYSNYGDSDCSQLPPSTDGLVLTQGTNIAISPYGIYTTADGLSSKVVELETEFQGSYKMAYLVNDNTLFFTFENNNEFNFDFNEPYTLNE